MYTHIYTHIYIYSYLVILKQSDISYIYISIIAAPTDQSLSTALGSEDKSCAGAASFHLAWAERGQLPTWGR